MTLFYSRPVTEHYTGFVVPDGYLAADHAAAVRRGVVFFLVLGTVMMVIASI